MVITQPKPQMTDVMTGCRRSGSVPLTNVVTMNTNGAAAASARPLPTCSGIGVVRSQVPVISRASWPAMKGKVRAMPGQLSVARRRNQTAPASRTRAMATPIHISGFSR